MTNRTSPLPAPFPRPAGASPRRKVYLLTLGYVLFITMIIVAADRGAWRGFFGLVEQIPGGDKLGHAVLMGTLARMANLCLGWRKERVFGLSVPLGSAAVLAFVILEECSQMFFPSRHFDLVDLLADCVGITLASLNPQRKAVAEQG